MPSPGAIRAAPGRARPPPVSCRPKISGDTTTPPAEAPEEKPPVNLKRVLVLVLVIVALYGDFLLMLFYRTG
jgi:hypothetical protein